MRALLVVLTIALTSFAGCTSPADSSGSPSASPSATSQSPSPTPTTTAATAPATTSQAPANQPPVATLEAIANGLNVTFNLTGTDPDDADEDLLWTLDAGDDLGAFEGEGLPIQVNHSYASAGNYSVVLIVSDGDMEDEANLTLNLTAGSAALQTVSTEWAAGFGGCGATYDPFPPEAAAEGAEVFWGYFEILPATYGRPFTVTFEVDAASNLGGGIDFYDAEGAVLEGGDIALAAPYVVTGDVPADAAYAITYSCGATGASAEYAAG